jgi:hypothetical protein
MALLTYLLTYGAKLIWPDCKKILLRTSRIFFVHHTQGAHADRDPNLDACEVREEGTRNKLCIESVQSILATSLLV